MTNRVLFHTNPLVDINDARNIDMVIKESIIVHRSNLNLIIEKFGFVNINTIQTLFLLASIYLPFYVGFIILER